MSKSKRTKACEIPPEVKKAVYARDKERCVGCGRWVEPRCACAHFVARAHGGLGIEQNIVTLCDDCHRIFDKVSCERSTEIGEAIYAHLRAIYGAENITRDKLVFSKWRFLE